MFWTVMTIPKYIIKEMNKKTFFQKTHNFLNTNKKNNLYDFQYFHSQEKKKLKLKQIN